MKQKTIQLEESERYFRSLIEKSSDAIVLIDANVHVLYNTPSTEKILGYNTDTIPAVSLYELIHPDDKRRGTLILSRLLSKPGSAFSSIFRIRNIHGEYLWVEGTFTNLLDDLSIKAIVFNFHDVTKRVESELTLNQITNDLMQRNTDLHQFAFIVSHNLRAPIANILGMANVLEYTESEKEREKILSYLFSAVNKMDEIIKDLNKILQARNENTEIKEVVNLQNLVDSISLGSENVLHSQNVTITTDFSAVTEIHTIKSYLQSIFYNLILNSIKYRSPDQPPLITIRSEKTDGKVKISFRDNGRGIDMKKNGNEVFRLYKRFHHDVEGKGIGLFMVKTQVEAIGGTIEVKSEIDVGTEFIITFNKM